MFTDRMRWYCENPKCRIMVYEEAFHCTDLGMYIHSLWFTLLVLLIRFKHDSTTSFLFIDFCLRYPVDTGHWKVLWTPGTQDVRTMPACKRCAQTDWRGSRVNSWLISLWYTAKIKSPVWQIWGNRSKRIFLAQLCLHFFSLSRFIMAAASIPGAPNMSALYATDEHGRPFIILREQEKKSRLSGIEAHKVPLIHTHTHATLDAHFPPSLFSRIFLLGKLWPTFWKLLWVQKVSTKLWSVRTVI